MAKKPTKRKAVNKNNIKDKKVADEIATGLVGQRKETKTKLVTKPTMVEQSIVAGVSTEDLEQGLKVQTKQRALIKDFVKNHLEDDVDFGSIHVMSKDKCKNGNQCEINYHWSKPILFKPGQEKLFSLFQITSKLERDDEAYTMLPDVRNLVAYKCIMFRNGRQIGEGRGAAVVGDKGRDPNSTIKIAEKRARIDACLSLGFSEYFAQDLDDPDYKSQAEMSNQRVALEAESRDKDEFGLFPRDAELPIDNKERAVLHRLILKAGFSEDFEILEVLRKNGIEDPTKMTSGQARELMSKLAHGMFAAPVVAPPDKPDVVVDPDDPEIINANGVDDPPAEPEVVLEPAEIVVDEDFINNVKEIINQIGFNQWGKSWMLQFVAGKPFGHLDDLTPAQWRKAYELVQQIMDGKLEVEKRYLTTGQVTMAIAGEVDSKPKKSQKSKNEAIA